MPAVPAIASRFLLYAALRALTALAPFLLISCASQPPGVEVRPMLEPVPSVATVLASPIVVVSPTLELRDTQPAPNSAPTQAAPAPPLDANRLPPFEGVREEIGKPRELARVDRTVKQDDLWLRIRDGFSMPDLAGSLVAEKTAWYVTRPEYLKRVFERSRKYLFHIVEEIEKRGLPTELALLPMVESSFNPMAYSRAHASGLWQFIPGTGKRYELTQNWWYDGRRDIVASTAAALDYLTDIYKMHGDWHLALASYNWGENAVARALEKNRAARLPLDYSSLSMPLETRHYVPKLQALKNIIANPALFGIELEPIPNQIYFTSVTKTRDIDVRLAAKLAEMSVEEFIALNPGFSRPVIRAQLTPRIVLPADRVAIFHENLSKYDDKSLVSWQTYQPKKGDTLEAIAKKFGVDLAELKEVNGIGRQARAMPALMVVPMASSLGRARDRGRLPIMYAPPIAVSGLRKFTHTVKAGETLPGIAQRYSVSVENLRRWNKIGRLAAGQKLSIQIQATPTRSKASAKTVKGKPRKPSVSKIVK
ncbi:MAG: LysM peptidoglycan-binding domain-containing protein [Betaproteobacteria bacterium]|nr:LysM peptidoglycan-binding domain-containing protein [Betaproteobacteria bacterium]